MRFTSTPKGGTGRPAETPHGSVDLSRGFKARGRVRTGRPREAPTSGHLCRDHNACITVCCPHKFKTACGISVPACVTGADFLPQIPRCVRAEAAKFGGQFFMQRAQVDSKRGAGFSPARLRNRTDIPSTSLANSKVRSYTVCHSAHSGIPPFGRLRLC